MKDFYKHVARRIKSVRIAKKAANKVEFPFELMFENKPTKRHTMTHSEAHARNQSIRCLGMFWRKAGY